MSKQNLQGENTMLDSETCSQCQWNLASSPEMSFALFFILAGDITEEYEGYGTSEMGETTHHTDKEPLVTVVMVVVD